MLAVSSSLSIIFLRTAIIFYCRCDKLSHITPLHIANCTLHIELMLAVSFSLSFTILRTAIIYCRCNKARHSSKKSHTYKNGTVQKGSTVFLDVTIQLLYIYRIELLNRFSCVVSNYYPYVIVSIGACRL